MGDFVNSISVDSRIGCLATLHWMISTKEKSIADNNNSCNENNARFRNPPRGHQDVPAGEGVPEVSGGV